MSDNLTGQGPAPESPEPRESGRIPSPFYPFISPEAKADAGPIEQSEDKTRAAVELEMSEVQIRKYRTLKAELWAFVKGVAQRSLSSWPECISCGEKKSLSAELHQGKIIPAWSCRCPHLNTIFTQPYNAPVAFVRTVAALGNPSIVVTELDADNPRERQAQLAKTVIRRGKP